MKKYIVVFKDVKGNTHVVKFKDILNANKFALSFNGKVLTKDE